ncbi:MAG: hypothetical protein LVQ95_00900 [Candidatus Micrarchaeales archaeon]|nr:hypothetical protein [Candidatus Micrarchaeales archaeon]
MSRVGTEGGRRLTDEARALLDEISRNSLFQSEKARKYSKPIRMLRKALERDPALVTILRSGLATTVSGVTSDLKASGIEKMLRRIRKASMATGKDVDDVLVAYISLKMFEESMKHRSGKAVKPVKERQQKAAPAKQQGQKPKEKAHHTPQITEAWLTRSARYMDYDWLKPMLDRRLSDEYRKKLLAKTLTPEEALSVYSLFLTAWVDSVQLQHQSEDRLESVQKLSREIKNISDIDTAVIAGRKALRLYALAMGNEELLACGLDRQERDFIRFEPSNDSQLLGNAYLWDHIYTMLLISTEKVEREIGLPPYPLDITEGDATSGIEIHNVNQKLEAEAR